MLTSEISKAVFWGNDLVTEFPFNFKVWSATQLLVEVTTPQGITHAVTNWTVKLSESGGTLSYMHEGAPLPTGYKLALLRNMPFSQEVDLISGTRFDPEVIEAALDKATAERQQLREAIERSIKLEASSDVSPDSLVQEIRDSTVISQNAAAIAESSAIISVDAATAAQKSADDAAKSAAEAGYAAGEEAVARVKAEGDTQVSLVHAEGDKVLSSMIDLASAAFLPGMVVAFTGSFGGPDNKHPIPTGSTEPDLTWRLHEPSAGRFILGGNGGNQHHQGGTPYTGGSTGVTTLTWQQMPYHNHTVVGVAFNTAASPAVGQPPLMANQITGVNTALDNGTHPAGGSQSHGHTQSLPPYYVLAYIEKLPSSGGGSGDVFVTTPTLNQELLTAYNTMPTDELSQGTYAIEYDSTVTVQVFDSSLIPLEEGIYIDGASVFNDSQVADGDVTVIFVPKGAVLRVETYLALIPDAGKISLHSMAPLYGKQDKLTAGANITIEGNVISATGGGTPYDDTVVKRDIATNAANIATLDDSKADKTAIPDVSDFATKEELTQGVSAKQDTLTAGANITIVGNIISATSSGGGGSAEGAVLYTVQDLTDEQQLQVSRNTGSPITDIYTTWEAGNINSSGAPVEGTIYYIRTADYQNIPELLVLPQNSGTTIVYYYSTDESLLGTKSYDGKGDTVALSPPADAHSLKIVTYVGSAGGSTVEAKIKYVHENCILRSDIYATPYMHKEYIRPFKTAASLTLKCAQEFTDLKSVATPNRYLWHDEDYAFYMSDSLKGEKKFVFKWSLPDTPDHYAMAFYGNDIIATFATATITTPQDEGVNVRRKPWVLLQSRNYTPVEIGISGKDYPSNWFANLGYWHDSMYTLGRAFFCEYTRPSTTKAYVWKLQGSVTSNSSWSIIHEHDVAQSTNNAGFKHYHHIQKDPWSDWIYFTTGDDEANSFIYGTKDYGATVELIYGPNQEYCRLLNFVFTPDAIYWASDNPVQDKHSLFKAVRVGDDLRMDVANATVLHRFDHTDGNDNATYCLSYIKGLNCLVVLERADGSTMNTPIYVWDFVDNTMKIADYMVPLIEAGYPGFRCTYYSVYPSDNTIAVGYNHTGITGFAYQNPNRVLQNTYGNIANLLLNMYRVGDGFSVGFETVR